MDEYLCRASMSSSRSSSSSVKNPYDYSFNTFKPVKVSSSEIGCEFLSVKCKCDLPAPCQEAWKEGTLDPGRRFFGCSQYKDPKKKCNFFLWADPPYPERARDVIKELKYKLHKKDDGLHNARVDMNFFERKMLVLEEEVSVLRKKNEDARGSLKKMEHKACIFRRMLIVSIVIIMIMWAMN